MEALAALLTRERLLVELLVFKLVELRQLLLSGEARFLGWASEEVERAATSVRTCELERAVLVAGLAADRGLPADTTLTALVADCPEPWRSMLTETQTAMRASAAEVSELLGATRRLAEVGNRGLNDTLRRLGAEPEPEPVRTTYGPAARWETAAPAARVSHEL